MYTIKVNKSYDFLNENYSSLYPNLHKYPATMLPQIGIKLLKELGIAKGALLDPYCGTGSSFVAGLASGIDEFHGFDINPLAILIAKAKYTKINKKKFIELKKNVIESIFGCLEGLELPNVTNLDFWFSKQVTKDLNIIKHSILFEIDDLKYQNIFWIAFSETVRYVSYTRNSEFKLYRMEEEKRHRFKPDVFEIFIKNLNKAEKIYLAHYYPLLQNKKISLYSQSFLKNRKKYDVVLTSPPYGDSRTTVAYGQYSTLSNEWMDVKNSRKIDSNLMGGYTSNSLYKNSILESSINSIAKIDLKRALQVSAFYMDLEESIKNISQSIKQGGYTIYVVGNRTVKNITLSTDQFIAEQFERNGLTHLFTYKRKISSKVMPSKNSPTNVSGAKAKTMGNEYIVVCQDKR